MTLALLLLLFQAPPEGDVQEGFVWEQEVERILLDTLEDVPPRVGDLVGVPVEVTDG